MLKKIDGFIVGLITMITIAFFVPGIGDKDDIIQITDITDIGISFIFFFYGLKLSPQQMKDGLSNYKLHLVVQLSTFLLFPLIAIALKPFYTSEDGKLLWLALFFMAALPSTVSSSVVMVSIAKGNISGAIFNASISGLIGILITPIWLSFFFQTSGESFNLMESVMSLSLRILLPVFIGLMLNKYSGAFAKKHSKYLTLFDKSIILLIVYNSFSHSFQTQLFQSLDTPVLIKAFISILCIFVLAYLAIWYGSKKLHFKYKDQITATFCGSKKSLVHGTVMADVLFKGMAVQGIFIVPIMIYHSLQLIVISFIAQRLSKNSD